MSDEITESGTIANPRYIDPPVVHLEQVIWCRYHLREVEALTVVNGNALCESCLYRA